MPDNPFMDKVSIYKWKLPPALLEQIATQFAVPGSEVHSEQTALDKQQLEQLALSSIAQQRVKK